MHQRVADRGAEFDRGTHQVGAIGLVRVQPMPGGLREEDQAWLIEFAHPPVGRGQVQPACLEQLEVPDPNDCVEVDKTAQVTGVEDTRPKFEALQDGSEAIIHGLMVAAGCTQGNRLFRKEFISNPAMARATLV